jgi:3-oxoacyl-[acyl-carrier protein] reductase
LSFEQHATEVGYDFGAKVAIVTGAGQGIGEAYARGLAAAGASVVVADLDRERGERAATSIVAAGGRAVFVAVDVSDPTSTDAMAATVAETLGGIDLLVNNAAIYHGMTVAPLTTVDLDYYNRIIATNLNGALHCTRSCFRSMAARGGGAIVNQSSSAAWMPGGYCSIAKVGVNALTVSLAAELGPMNIRVNALAPGPTDTEATRLMSERPGAEPWPRVDTAARLPLRRLGTPEDIVGACLFLLSDAAAWLTGQIIAVDGGQTVRL